MVLDIMTYTKKHFPSQQVTNIDWNNPKNPAVNTELIAAPVWGGFGSCSVPRSGEWMLLGASMTLF